MRKLLPVLAILVGGVALALAGCGGGGGSTTPLVGPVPTAAASANIPVGPSPATAVISGGGYTLTFTVPAISGGTTATISAALTTMAPLGVPTPSSVSRGPASMKRTPSTVGVPLTNLVYLTVKSSATLTLGSVPSFTYTLPAGVTVPSGSSAYVLFYDPSQSATGWLPVLGPGTVNGQNVTFAGVSSTFTLTAGLQYVYALVLANQVLPSPIPSPGIAPTPADCPSNFTSAAGGAPLQITDDSGLSNAQLVVYVQNGTSWLSNDGTFDASAPNPLPAACFKTTTGSSGTQPLNIPLGAGGRIYFAYGPTPSPGSSTIPNPFSGQNLGGPNPGYSANPFPWDFVEYGTTAGATIDTTQVDALQLPLELSVGATPLPATAPGAMPTLPPPGATPAPCPTNGPATAIVGVTGCNFANVFLAIEQLSSYAPLVVAQPFLGQTYDLQVVAPHSASGTTAFQWNLFGNSLPSPIPAICPANPPYGYLSCVLAAYKASPQLFTSVVPGAGPVGSGPDFVTGDNYCVTSDGTKNFLATDVGPTGTCLSTPNPTGTPYPFHINVANFMYGTPPVNDNGGVSVCKTDLFFQQPWGLANINGTSEAIATGNANGHLFAFDDSFALWKALTADIDYGTALVTPPAGQTHPIAPSGPSQIFTTLFQDPMFDRYDYILHTYFDSNLTYGTAYDDLYKLESGVTWYAPDPIDVRINAIPTSAVTLPSQPITPVGVPSPCNALQAPIGSF